MSRGSLKDIAIALGVGAFVGVSPFTPDDLLPSIALGGLAAVFLFVYRTRLRGDTSDVYWDGRRKLEAIRIADITPAIWIALGLFAVVFTPTVMWMYKKWTMSVWQNNHGMFIPVLMVLLGRSVLRRYDDVQDDSSPWGFAFLGLGLLLVVLDSAVHTMYLAAVGFVVALPGLSLLLLGVERTKALRLVLMLGIFMIPVPYTLSNHLFLRNTTAAGTVPMLHALGIPASRDFSVINLPDTIFIVSEACSGFATLYSALALTVFLLCYCASPVRRALLVLAFIPLALAANVVRVLTLVLLGHWGSLSLLDTALHEASGVASFVVIIVVLFFLADRATLRNAFQ
jgi:exosortase